MTDKNTEKTLVDAAIEQGGVVESVETKKFAETRTIKDVLGDGKIEFHGDLPKIKFAELLGQNFIIKQVRVIDDWDGVFGTSEFALTLVEFPDGRLVTTIAGGRAIMRQTKKLIDKRMLPVRVTLTQKPSPNGDYYMYE